MSFDTPECITRLREEFEDKFDNKGGRKFMTDLKLNKIWREFSRTKCLSSSRNPCILCEFKHDIKHATEAARSVHKIVSILIYTNENALRYFRQNFLEQHHHDKDIPFSQDSLCRPEYLGRDYGPKFYEHQYIFEPIIIKQNQDIDESSPLYRLPFTEVEPETEVGGYGEVSKVHVAKGCFQSADGEHNSKKQKALARKQFVSENAWREEVENLKRLRTAAMSHDHVLGHVGTLRIDKDCSILFELAHGNLYQFLHEEISHPPGERCYRDFLEQMGWLASALGFLHHRFVVDGNSLHCYHMDLKPENILVFFGDKHPVGKWVIADFGISKFHEITANSLGSKTKPPRGRGPFLPPEIDEEWLGRPQGVNAKGDIWSFGGILSLVLAYAMSGKTALLYLDAARKYSATTTQAQDFFYVLSDATGTKEPILKPKISTWLAEAISDKKEEWVSACVALIRECLNPRLPARRPDADKITKSLKQIRTERGRIDSVGGTSLPLRILATGAAATMPVPKTPSLPHSLHEEPVWPVRTAESPSTMRSGGLGHQRASREEAIMAPSSTLSVTEYKFAVGGLQNLLKTRDKNWKDTLIAICPRGRSLLIATTASCDLYPMGLAQMEIGKPQIIKGRYTRPTTAGAFSLLRDNRNMTFRFQRGEQHQDTIDNRSFGYPLNSVCSVQGSLLFVYDRKLRNYQDFMTMTLSAEFQIPYNHENFLCASFSRDGNILIAVGIKHWFAWIVNPEDHTWIQRPAGHGRYPAQTDTQKPTPPMIIAFSHRNGFLSYDSKTETLYLYDFDNPMKHFPVRMDGAAVSPSEDLLLYLKVEQKQKSVKLYQRSLHRMTIGQEQHVQEVNLAFRLEKGVKFTMAFDEHDELIIVSNQAEVQRISISRG